MTGRYNLWSSLSATGTSPSRPLSHVNGHDGPTTLSPAAAAMAAAATVYSRLSPYDALYASPFHTSPTALSFRGLSPGKCRPVSGISPELVTRDSSTFSTFLSGCEGVARMAYILRLIVAHCLNVG